MHELGGAKIAAQRVVGFGDVEDENVASADGCGNGLKDLRGRIQQKELRTGVKRGRHSRRHVRRRFCRDTV